MKNDNYENHQNYKVCLPVNTKWPDEFSLHMENMQGMGCLKIQASNL